MRREDLKRDNEMFSAAAVGGEGGRVSVWGRGGVSVWGRGASLSGLPTRTYPTSRIQTVGERRSRWWRRKLKSAASSSWRYRGTTKNVQRCNAGGHESAARN